MAFHIEIASLPQEKPAIDEFLQAYFFQDLNVLTLFDAKEEAPPPIPDNADLVVKAVDSTGGLVGVAYCTTRPTSLWLPERSEKQKQLVEFFEYFEDAAGLHSLPECTLELWLLAVRADWGRRGVARTLVAESVKHARCLGYKMMTMTCLNEYTQQLAERLGWRERYRLAYLDYPKLSGREHIQLRPTPPHHTLYFYVTDL